MISGSEGCAAAYKTSFRLNQVKQRNSLPSIYFKSVFGLQTRCLRPLAPKSSKKEIPLWKWGLQLNCTTQQSVRLFTEIVVQDLLSWWFGVKLVHSFMRLIRKSYPLRYWSVRDHIFKLKFFYGCLIFITVCPDLIWPGEHEEACSGWDLNLLLCSHNTVTTLPFEGAVIGHECEVSSSAFPAVGPLGAFTEEQWGQWFGERQRLEGAAKKSVEKERSSERVNGGRESYR